MGRRRRCFIEHLSLSLDKFLRPRESDCIRSLSKDATTSRARCLTNFRNPSPRPVKPMPQEDNTILEIPSCQGRYVGDFLKSPRDSPSNPHVDRGASLHATLGRRRANRSVKGIWMVASIPNKSPSVPALYRQGYRWTDDVAIVFSGQPDCFWTTWQPMKKFHC
jgi:hypothetical protein